jgi:predicted TIM-barrel fold metal-dependent hydrolase
MAAGFKNCRRELASVCAIGLLFVLSGCGTTKICLTPEQRCVLRELEQIDPRQDPIPAETPIVDIHTHTFNARYLPLQGILLGKRDAAFPITTLVTDKCATNIARQLINCTELDSPPAQCPARPKRSTEDVRATGNPGLICKIFLDIIDDAVKGGAWAPGKGHLEQLHAVDTVARNMSLRKKLAIRATTSMMGMQTHTKGGKETAETVDGIQAAMRFLWMLTQNDREIPEIYRAMQAKVPVKGQITMISHMMDLGPVYDQAADGCALLDFPSEQVRRMEQYSKAANSGLYYFVAYNPYRDFLAGAPANAALEVVKEAWVHHGAKGIKVYPPSGYRAAGNDIEPRPCAISPVPGREWDARYAAMGQNQAARNATLDRELNTLLEWCISNDVPVLAHSGYGEFEARKGYGEYHSNPEFWERFLVSHSKPGEPCKLRLCLGHAGGEDFWVGTGTHAEWGKRVFRLCTTYPNVYCEITTSDKMVEPTTRAYMAYSLIQLFEQTRAAPYPFAKKLLYGTDWPLPDQGKPEAVLLGTQRIFLHPKLRQFYADYFFGNANRFLNFDATSHD